MEQPRKQARFGQSVLPILRQHGRIKPKRYGRRRIKTLAYVRVLQRMGAISKNQDGGDQAMESTKPTGIHDLRQWWRYRLSRASTVRIQKEWLWFRPTTADDKKLLEADPDIQYSSGRNMFYWKPPQRKATQYNIEPAEPTTENFAAYRAAIVAAYPGARIMN